MDRFAFLVEACLDIVRVKRTYLALEIIASNVLTREKAVTGSALAWAYMHHSGSHFHRASTSLSRLHRRRVWHVPVIADGGISNFGCSLSAQAEW